MKKNLLLALASAFLMFFGCWPLEPRPAEFPESPAAAIMATEPSQIPEIIGDIYKRNLPNDIGRILSDDFKFYTDPLEQASRQDWGKQDEARITGSIINSESPATVQFSMSSGEPDPVAVHEDPVWITRFYLLIARERTGSEKIYKGKAEFLAVYEPTRAEWLLKQWNDFKTDSLPTWGQLKLENH